MYTIPIYCIKKSGIFFFFFKTVECGSECRVTITTKSILITSNQISVSRLNKKSYEKSLEIILECKKEVPNDLQKTPVKL